MYSAPIIISNKHTEVKKLLTEIFSEENTDKLDQLHQELSGIVFQEETIVQLKEFSSFFSKRALDSLDLFPESDAKEALVNIANSCAYPG